MLTEEDPAPPDIPGVLGGSRLYAQPEVVAELGALRDALSSRPCSLLEIGFDHGRRLSATAAASPGWSVVGVEVRRARVDEARARAERDGLSNLSAFRLDGRAALALGVAPQSVDIIEALFPTPWAEGKTRRRLLVTPAFAAAAAAALRPGGLLHIATDVDWYAELIDVALRGEPDLQLVEPTAALTARPPCSQQSRREWRCQQDGLPVHRFVAMRSSSS